MKILLPTDGSEYSETAAQFLTRLNIFFGNRVLAGYGNLSNLKSIGKKQKINDRPENNQNQSHRPEKPPAKNRLLFSDPVMFFIIVF